MTRRTLKGKRYRGLKLGPKPKMRHHCRKCGRYFPHLSDLVQHEKECEGVIYSELPKRELKRLLK